MSPSSKAATCCRTPKPRGIFQPALKIDHSFIETALKFPAIGNLAGFFLASLRA
jgi:hypothetical protein